MFENRSISIMAYNLKTVLAEKFDTDTFRAALDKTIEKRHTAEQMSGVTEAIAMIMENAIMVSLWERYQKKYFYAADISWDFFMLFSKQ
jgi:hypothetical protein